MHRSEGIRSAEKIGCEQRGRLLIEAPIGQRHTRIEGLQLTLEIQDESAMPRQETRRAMRLRQPVFVMYVAKISVVPRAFVVQLSQCGDEAVALSRRQSVRVLPDANHERHLSQHLCSGHNLNGHVPVRDARLAKLTSQQE